MLLSKPRPETAKTKFCTFYPHKNSERVGEISQSIFRRIIYALCACFRFPLHCSVLKPERFKGDRWVENRGQTVYFFTRRKIQGRWARCLSEFAQFGIRSNLRHTFDGTLLVRLGCRGRLSQKDGSALEAVPTTSSDYSVTYIAKIRTSRNALKLSRVRVKRKCCRSIPGQRYVR